MVEQLLNKRKVSSSLSLSFEVPHDIIRLILIASPKRSLFNTLRLVCKSWARTITTDPAIPHNLLLPSNPPGIILQTLDHTHLLDPYTTTTCFIKLPVVVGRGGKQEEEVRLDLTPCFRYLHESLYYKRIYNLHIVACCNGVMLATSVSPPGFGGGGTLYLVNPITNQRKQLPSRKQANAPGLPTFFGPTSFVFVPSTGEYKVVVMRESSTSTRQCFTYKILTVVFDVGSTGTTPDSQWRCIQPPSKREFLEKPLAIDGILHWCSRNYLVSFNATTETFFKRKLPVLSPQLPRNVLRGFFSGLIDMGGVICFWSIGLNAASQDSLPSPENSQKLSVWILEDWLKGEWVRKYSTTLQFLNDGGLVTSVYNFDNINSEVILRRIFEHEKYNTILAYNLESHHYVTMFNTMPGHEICFFGPHTGSVVAKERTPFSHG